MEQREILKRRRTIKKEQGALKNEREQGKILKRSEGQKLKGAGSEEANRERSTEPPKRVLVVQLRKMECSSLLSTQ